MIGAQISHYLVLEKLGAGGMGIVYKAEDITLKRHAALKFLPADLTADREAKDRFILEAQAASALNHAHITTIYGIEESPEGLFIAMEYIDGKTLKQLLVTETLPLQKVLDIAIQVCEGLAAAHEMGIVHRDIKSDNIMLTTRGEAKIMDFGLAKLRGAEKLTKSRSTLGTLSYMSPEQALGEEVDRRSDIFSFGVVLYEMLAGRLPFTGDYQAAVLYAIIHDAPQPVARYNIRVSGELERIVAKAMAKDREERYQHADDLLADLRHERKSLEYVKVGQVRGEIIAPKAKKRKWLLAAAAAAVVAAAALILFLFSPFKLKIGPREEVQAKENSLAVMYFENLQDPEDKNKTAQMITALLTTGLSDSPRYIQVVSSQRLYDILKLLGKEDLKTVDRSVASEVARKAGVQWMVTGKVLSIEPSIVLVSEISDVASGKILATQRVNGAPGEGLFSVVDQLSPQVVKALELPEQAQKELGKPVAEATTHSQEAYRCYLEGIENFNKAYFSEAVKNFEQALAYDPGFAGAYFMLALIHLDNEEYRQAKALLGQAMKYSASMSQKEKLYAQAMAEIIAGRFEKAIKTIEEIARRFPNEKEAFFWLAKIYGRNLHNPAEAIRWLNKAIAINPLYKFAYNVLAYDYNEIGDLEKSLWAINKYISLAPGEANPYDTRGDLYAYNGQLDAAIASYEKALAVKPDFLMSLNKIGMLRSFKKEYAEAGRAFAKVAASSDPIQRVTGRTSLSMLPAYQGKFKLALAALSKAIAANEREHYAGVETGYNYINKAMIHEARGELDLAIAETRTALEFFKKSDPDAPFWFSDYYTHLLLQKGKTAEAEDMVRRLKDESETNWQLRFTYWRAEGVLAMARNDLAVARNYFEKDKLIWFWKVIFQARIYLRQGALDKAVTVLEKALNRYDYDRFYNAVLSVKAYYLLAQAYERSGWKDKAIQNYEEFLDIWRNADPGLPEVVDARQRLAKLKQQ